MLPEISIFIGLLSRLLSRRRRHGAARGALLAARQSFHCQFSATRDDPILGPRARATFARLLIRLFANSITNLADLARAPVNRSERFSLGSQLRSHALRITRFRRCISQRADKCAVNRVASCIASFIRHEIFIRSLLNDQNVGTCPTRSLASHYQRTGIRRNCRIQPLLMRSLSRKLVDLRTDLNVRVKWRKPLRTIYSTIMYFKNVFSEHDRSALLGK